MSPLDFIKNNAETFAQNGSVVASYRTRGTKRYGPYYRVAYRAAGRQCSVYLGRCKRLAARVRKILAHLQQSRDYRRLCKKAEPRTAKDQPPLRHPLVATDDPRLRPRPSEAVKSAVGARSESPAIDKTTPYTPDQKAAVGQIPPTTHVLKLPLPPALDPRYWQNGTPVDQQLPTRQPSNHAIQRTNTDTNEMLTLAARRVRLEAQTLP